MRIQVISKESDKSWYANHVGGEFTVIWEMDSTYLVESSYGPMAIGKKHAKVISNYNIKEKEQKLYGPGSAMAKAPKFGVKHIKKNYQD